jgi:hypothetical protein
MENVKLLGKLLELQQSVRGLLPDSTGGTGNYRYVSGAKLLGVVRPKMDELGLLLKSEILEVVNTRTDYTVGRDARPKAEMHTCLRMRFTWIDTESGEREVCEWAANGQNDWDKGAGSAMTYGERYFLMKFFHIPTDEDDVDARQGDAQEGDKTEPSQAVHPTPSPRPVFIASKLDDEISRDMLCRWIAKKESEASASGRLFSLYGLLENTYTITKEELQHVAGIYDIYKKIQEKIS